MYSLRRAALSLKLRGSWLGRSRAVSVKSDILSSFVRDTADNCTLERLVSGKYTLSNELFSAESVDDGFFVGSCGYCSQASATAANERDGLDLEIDMSAASEISNAEEVDGEELVSELEFLGDNDQSASSEKDEVAVELLNSIMGSWNGNLYNVLDKWAKEGNKLSLKGILMIMVSLKKRRMFSIALKFSEWLEKSGQIDLTEQYYAYRIDLIYKAQNLEKAEKFVDIIPEPFKGELAYTTLLRSCVHALSRRKAESLFEKIRDLRLPITVDACNKMIILYKKLDKKKIADILLIMEKQNIKPSLLTYKLLIDNKGESNDIMGMEQLVEAMKADGIEPDIFALTVLAKHYISGGLKHKAETILKEIEERKLKGILGAHKSLLLLYASIGRADEVAKVWKDCESDPKMQECIAAIEAWGKLGKVEEAETVFNMMLQKWRLTSRHYSLLLEAYVNNNLLNKGKDLAKQMVDNGCWVGQLACDALVRLYIEAGDLEKADSILQKAPQQKKMRPLFKTLINVMEQYAKRVDIHNAERLFQRTKEFGYTGRFKTFEVLIQAYINAKTPAYGFRERMIVDNVFSNRAFAKQLAQVDAFRNTVSDLLD